MITMKVGVEGMMCGMCEAHVNEAVRNAVPVKKVKSSRRKKQTVIVCEEGVDQEAIKKAIVDTGYTVTSIEVE